MTKWLLIDAKDLAIRKLFSIVIETCINLFQRIILTIFYKCFQYMYRKTLSYITNSY